MIAGVIRLGPSQLKPLKGSANVLRADRDLVLAVADVLEGEGAVLARSSCRLDALPPSAPRSSTVTPARPTSPLSTSPGVPPPGLKSRQTTPVIPPCSGSGWTAARRVLGHSRAPRIAVRPSSAESPGLDRVLERRSPASGVPVSVVASTGARRSSTPCSLTIPWTPTIAALMAPRSGSCWYMIRQITPTANSETASGMKTAILNAGAQRTRSVEHGEDEADRRDAGGDDQHPEDVVLDRRLDALVREHPLVVVEPDELVAAVVEEAPSHRRERRVDDPDAEEEGRRQQERQRQHHGCASHGLCGAAGAPLLGGNSGLIAVLLIGRLGSDARA